MTDSQPPHSEPAPDFLQILKDRYPAIHEEIVDPQPVDPGPLTLREKLNGAVNRAKMQTAELHFWEKNQPFYPLRFSVHYRNPGHWDVYAPSCPGEVSAWKEAHGPGSSTTARDGETERAFRIRGEPGKVLVTDERWDPTRKERGWITFRSIYGAMAYIVEELMQEPSPK